MKARSTTRSVLLAAAAALAVLSAGAVSLRPGETEVVIAPRAPSVVRFAAEEATNLLSRVFGSAVPVVNAPTEGRTSVILGVNDWSKAAGLEPAKLPRDSYLVKAEGSRLYIAGVDEANFDIYRFFKSNQGYGTLLAANERATLFGVYGCLEKYAGVRFILPDEELGTIVPRKAELVIPDGIETVTPDYLLRNPYFGEDGRWPFKSYAGRNVKSMLWLRQRYASCIIPCCHGSRDFKYIERFGKTHPEYLAKKKNGSVRLDPKEFAAYQLCWTNPGLREELYQDVKAYLTGQPASSRGLKGWGNNCRYGKYVDIMPDDSFQGCACTNCQAAYRCPEGKDPANHRCNYATDLMWGVARDFGERLIREGIDGNITLMSYFPYGQIPSFDLPTNVHVMVAKGGPWTLNQPKTCAADQAAVRAWAKKLGHKVWIWTYPSKFGTLMIKGAPCIAPHAWGKYYADLHDAIIGGFMECECDEAIYNALNYYVFSHVMWDHTTDVDQLLDEAYALMFGPGADEMKRFFEKLEAIWTGQIVGQTVDTPLGPKSSRPDDLQIWTSVYTPAVRAELRAYLDAAAAKVAADSLEAKRMALFRREIFDRLDAQAAEYMDALSVEKALAHRATLDPKDNIVLNPDCTRPLTADRFFGYYEKGKWLGGWHAGKKGDCTIDTNVFVTGHASFRLSGKGVSLSQYLSGNSMVPALKPSTRYRLSFFIKFENVVSHGAGLVANIWDDKNVWFPSASSVPKGSSFTGSADWIYQSFDFTTGPKTNLGTSRSYLNFTLLQSEGTFWVDGIRLAEVASEQPKTKVGVYVGSGAQANGVCFWQMLTTLSPDLEPTFLDEKTIAAGALKGLDLVIMPGGSSYTEFDTLHSTGADEMLKDFIRQGGGFYGTCAGNSIILNEKRRLCLSPYTRYASSGQHGTALMTTVFNKRAEELCGIKEGPRKIRYSGGPVLKPGEPVEGGSFETIGVYDCDFVCAYGTNTVIESMKGCPSAICGTYGKGRVFAFATHPEYRADTLDLLAGGFRYLTGREIRLPRPQRKKGDLCVAVYAPAMSGLEDARLIASLVRTPGLDVSFMNQKEEIGVGLLDHADVLVLPGGREKIYTDGHYDSTRLYVQNFVNQGGRVVTYGAGAKGAPSSAKICQSVDELVETLRAW